MSTWPAVIDRATSDPEFREKLLSNPTSTCREAGCPMPPGATVDVIEQQACDLHLFLGSKTGETRLDALLEKAHRDPTVKQQLLANPRPMVESAIGRALPADAAICVHERKPNCIRIVLSADSQADSELSDQALAAVAGGGLLRNMFCRNKVRKETDNVNNVYTEETNYSSGWTITDIDIV